MGRLSSEFREPNRKDKVTRFRSETYVRLLGLLVNTLGSHLRSNFSLILFIYNLMIGCSKKGIKNFFPRKSF